MRYLYLAILLFLIGCSMNSGFQGSSSSLSDPASDPDASNFQPTEVIKTELSGSLITIAAPASWNKKILMIAHGYRPEDAELSSQFGINDPFYQKLLNAGWLLASTSYRRNGYIIKDAITDLEILRNFLETRYEKADEVYLIGSSMGATISTLIAEDPALPYTGILAIGFPRISFLTGSGMDYTYQPQIPILFLSNRDEAASPQEYVKKVQNSKLKPAFWSVARVGHCLVNSAEISTAFSALTGYVETGNIELKKDATIQLTPQGSEAEIRDGKAYARVLSIHPSYGNFVTDITEADLAELGIAKDTYFRVGKAERQFRIFYGTTYSDVQQGFWIAFLTAEGYLRIARNFANAAETLHCSKGDTIYIASLPAEEIHLKPYIEPGTKAVDLGIASWEALISGDPQQAVKLAEEGLMLSPDLLWLQMNLAHAYLYAGEYEEAVEIYKRNKGKHVFKESFYFEDLVLEDLDKLESEGIKSEYTDRIRELLITK